MVTNTPNRVWSVTLDDRYIVTVDRTGEFTGELVIRDGDKELLREPIKQKRSFDRVAWRDVAAWQLRAERFVDEGK